MVKLETDDPIQYHEDVMRLITFIVTKIKFLISMGLEDETSFDAPTFIEMISE